jgi:uncharacterized protein YoxC
MITVLYVVISVAIVVLTAFLVPFIIEARKTVTSLRKLSEEKLDPALAELEENLKNLRNITDDINDVTGEVRQLSNSIGEVGRTVNSVKGFVDDISSSGSIRASSIKTGLRVGVQYLLTNLIKKGDGK